MYIVQHNQNLYQIHEDGQADIIGSIDDTELNEELFKLYGTTNINLIKNFAEKKNNITIYTLNDIPPMVQIKGKRNLLTIDKSVPSHIYTLAHLVEDYQELYAHIVGKKDLRQLSDSNINTIYVSQDTGVPTVPIAKIRGYSSPQIIKASGDIKLSKVGYVNNFTLKHTDPKEKLRVAYSLDSGETWLTKSIEDNTITTKTINVDSFDDMVENGMTMTTFNSIKDKWTDEIVAKGKIRFAYLFDIDDIDDKCETHELSINVNMYGSWKSQRHKKSNKIEYTNNELIVIFYQDGTYKINYQS